MATQLLIKLHDNGTAWATADRAVQAARSGDDPMVLADAGRLAANVMRRTQHRDGAQKLMLDTARALQDDTGLSEAAHSALYGQLLAAASYTAAMRDDRDSAWTLLGEAEDAARRAGDAKSERFNMLELAVYKISVSRVLGDYGTAVDFARLVDPARIISRSAAPGTGRTPPWHYTAAAARRPRFRRCWPPNATARRRSGSGHGRSSSPPTCFPATAAPCRACASSQAASVCSDCLRRPVWQACSAANPCGGDVPSGGVMPEIAVVASGSRGEGVGQESAVRLRLCWTEEILKLTAPRLSGELPRQVSMAADVLLFARTTVDVPRAAGAAVMT
ncbi:hypothetical protein [Micromonospora sp. 067-2]|uniref:hypothetical protein n=1 Tax=Micromonospora sp. 067-2 TaxID=2789270 RepID=UPI00397A5B05